MATEIEWTDETWNVLVESGLDKPLRWQKPRTVFVNSMSDLFHDDVTDEWRDSAFGIIAATPRHHYVVLTKRIAEAVAWYRRTENLGGGDSLANVWLGPSVWDQASWDAAVPHVCALREVGWQTVVSAEPLLGPILPVSGRLVKVSWLIVGGETGPGARPMDVRWARRLRVNAGAVGVPFFFKHGGAEWPDGGQYECCPPDMQVREFPWEADDAD